MAIDLSSSLSPYEFKEMSSLDLLAAVASETLKNVNNSDDSPGKKTTSNSKKQLKKSSATTAMAFEDVKALPIKSLVEKFSEMTSDELTKKYFYKCLLIPEKCAMTFKSFGNEKKACDKIKSHLLSHLQQFALEGDSDNEVSSIIFVPKSPNSKHTEKFSKKSLKKQQTPMSQMMDHNTNCHKVSKKVKNSTYSVKRVKKKFHKLNQKSVAEFNKGLIKNKKRMFNSVYLKEKPGTCTFDGSSTSKNENMMLPNKIKREAADDLDLESDKERYNSYSKYLKYDFLPQSYVKDEDGHEAFIKSQETSSLDNSNNFQEANSSDKIVVSHDKSFIFLQDHNYSVSDETKCDKLSSQEVKYSSRKNITCFIQQPKVQPQLIIKTPPFPYIHTPLLPEVAVIKEIGLEETSSSYIYEHSNYYDYLCDEERIKFELNDVQTDDQASDQEDKFPATIFCKMNGASGSVLECVENIVNTKYSSSCVPKSEIPAAENDENLENLQRIEKELALKYIAKLHAKKKKRIPDSLFCQICPDKHFTAQATLIHHYRSHAGIKPYMCKICDSTFTRQHSLNYHMLIHQNLSRFTCEFCGRTFRHPSHYKEHLRRHTGETPYHCTDCNLHFKTRNTFKRHLKTRHGKLLTATGIEDLTVEEYAKYCPKSKLGKQ